MITSIRDFFRAIRKKFSRQARKFWKFLQDNVFPIITAVILEELKDAAMAIVSSLNGLDITNEEKRQQAFNEIKNHAKATGRDIKDSLVYMLIEIAVTALKNEVGRVGK